MSDAVLLILSAPSGAGKTTIARQLQAVRSDTDYSISATTRAPRAGERDGVDYYFMDRAEFDRRVAGGDFLEWAEYGGNRYGTLRSEIARITGSGRHAILDIEVQGARQVRDRWDSVRSVFIIPPSAQVLLDRLGGRRSEDAPGVRRRLERALDELAEAPAYDHVVINADLAEAVTTVADILDDRPPAVSRAALNAQVERLRRELAVELARGP